VKLRAALLALSVFTVASCNGYAAPVAWKVLRPGIEYAALPVSGQPLHVVRVDPKRAELVALLASEKGTAPQTAGQWCRSSHVSVAINLGMYAMDHRAHTGYLRNGKHVNNADWNEYKSVLALHPRASGIPAMQWIDVEISVPRDVLDQYGLVVQNLRLIARPGRNVWAPNERKWSEAALALDSANRLLFIFSRAPYTMKDFNLLLMRLPLDVQSAMHLEGGPEASLSIHAAGVDLDSCGSYETSFVEDESNVVQWPLPNVLGAR
jgi:hypothetical protein